MSTLSDFVHVGRRFQRSVRVDTDLDDMGALDGFICPPSISHALLGMASQIIESGHGAFTWTGPYGSGKSSLALALATLLGPAGSHREKARAAIGAETADRLTNLLASHDDGWAVVPVVGRRADPAAVIMGAIEGRAKSRRRSASTGDAVERLRAIAAEAPGRGVFIVIDEMGKFLEQAASGDADVYFFQQLAEAATRSNGRLLVVGILHQSFDDYANRMAREVRDEWLKIQGRFIDIPINVAGEEQIALIGRAIEAAKPDSSTAATGISDAIRRNRPAVAAELAGELASCWPLHPIVASLLGPLSRRRFGQNQRSVFGFLNSSEPNGFQDFLRTSDATIAQTYDPPRLWDYLRANLEPSILASPDGHRWSLAVEAVERCEARGGDLDHLQLVKTIALIDLFKERSGLLPSMDVLVHGLAHIAPERLREMIEHLSAWSIVIFKRHQGAYAIYAGSDFDIDAAASEARARATGIDFERLRNVAALQPVLAKRHYHRTGALRWFDIDIAPLADGVDAVSAAKPRNGATGLFLLLIGTEGETDIKARRLWQKAVAAAGDTPIVVGWTRDSFMIRDLASELLALETIRAERAELNGDAVARREVDARIARTGAELEDRLRQSFVTANWASSANREDDILRTVPTSGGLVGLNLVASQLAEAYYPQSPLIYNELLNRIKPSSNAVAAQKALLKVMVEAAGQPRLGIIGFPAEGGLYASILEQTRLYRADPDRPGTYRFMAPDAADDPANLIALWHKAEAHFQAAGTSGATLKSLYDLWQAPPFGVRDGLLPVLAVAFLMSRVDRLSVYLNGAFQASLTSLLIDHLSQDPAKVRLRWSDITDFHLKVLRGVSKIVALHGGVGQGQLQREPLDIARGLVGIIHGLKPWVLKTSRLSERAIKVRNLAKIANDPNKFLLDDIPALFGADQSDATSAVRIVKAVEEGLSELVSAYDNMLHVLERTMFVELRISSGSAHDLVELRKRAEVIKGLTGNYRLDAFATRLATYTVASENVEDLEGIASLAANKPPRDWVDRDIDQARVEIAALAEAFVAAESLAHVKGRTDQRTVMAFHISDPTRLAPVKLDFDITQSQKAEVAELVARLSNVVKATGASRSIVLAAFAEMSGALDEILVSKPVTVQRRKA